MRYVCHEIYYVKADTEEQAIDRIMCEEEGDPREVGQITWECDKIEPREVIDKEFEFVDSEIREA